MSTRNLVTKALVVSSLWVLTGISACDENKDIENWVENTNKLRVEAQKKSEVVPYRKAQFQALKNYFGELANMSLSLKNDAKFAERFNAAVAKSDLGAVCGKVLMQKNSWRYIMERCTKNNFFLCSEEVRAYPDIVAAMREKLVAEQKQRFDKAPLCRAALEINR